MGMMSESDIWMNKHLNTLSDGQYWHVPSDDLVFKVSKSSRRLTLIDGDKNSAMCKRIAQMLDSVGYSLAYSEENYFCC